MSTQNNQNSEEPETETYAEGCQRIIGKFNDPSMPISTWDFKTMLFFCLLDAHAHRDESVVTDHHVSMMYFLWDILDEIEKLVVSIE